MNYCTIFFVLFGFISSFTPIHCGNEGYFLGKYLIRSLKPGPMNIVTSKVKKIKLSPLKIKTVLNEKVTLNNTGNAVSGKVDPGTKSTLTGGPFKNKVYKYYGVQYYWSGNTTGPAATTINGKNGSPIEALSYWFNRKYGSYKKAIKYRDGLAVISTRISVNSAFNKIYTNFSRTLEKIKKPGSSVKVDHKTLFNWYNKFPKNISYYAYPGCRTNRLTGKKRFCAILCILEPIIPAMSVKQFKGSFLSLLNKKGKTLTNSFPAYPQAGTPVVRASGFIQSYVNL